MGDAWDLFPRFHKIGNLFIPGGQNAVCPEFILTTTFLWFFLHLTAVAWTPFTGLLSNLPPMCWPHWWLHPDTQLSLSRKGKKKKNPHLSPSTSEQESPTCPKELEVLDHRASSLQFLFQTGQMMQSTWLNKIKCVMVPVGLLITRTPRTAPASGRCYDAKLTLCGPVSCDPDPLRAESGFSLRSPCSCSLGLDALLCLQHITRLTFWTVQGIV